MPLPPRGIRHFQIAEADGTLAPRVDIQVHPTDGDTGHIGSAPFRRQPEPHVFQTAETAEPPPGRLLRQGEDERVHLAANQAHSKADRITELQTALQDRERLNRLITERRQERRGRGIRVQKSRQL